MSLTKEDVLAWFEMQVRLPITGEIPGFAEEAAMFTSGRLHKPEDVLLQQETSRALERSFSQHPGLKEQTALAVFQQARFFKAAFEKTLPRLFAADGAMDSEMMAEFHAEVNLQLSGRMHQTVEVPLRNAGLTVPECEEVGDKMQQALQISMAKFVTRNLSPAQREDMWNKTPSHVARLRAQQAKSDPDQGRGG